MSYISPRMLLIFCFQTFTLTGDELKQTALFWTYMFLVLAVVSGLSFYLQVSLVLIYLVLKI